jgi:hypothetical protein
MQQVGPKTAKARPRGSCLGSADWKELPMRNGNNFLLVREDCFLVGQNCFLIRENFIQRGLVLQDCCLIVEQRFLIFQNGSLVAEDGFLIGYDFVF